MTIIDNEELDNAGVIGDSQPREGDEVPLEEQPEDAIGDGTEQDDDEAA